jgi:DNA repair protein RAD50
MTSRAALEKLAIRGIRSFDDKRVEVLEFFTPVTVIVGQNGSGKTVCTSNILGVL